MAPSPPPQVGGEADVQGAVAFAGEDVDARGAGVGRGHGEMVEGCCLRVGEVWDRFVGMKRRGYWLPGVATSCWGCGLLLGPGWGRRDGGRDGALRGLRARGGLGGVGSITALGRRDGEGVSGE